MSTTWKRKALAAARESGFTDQLWTDDEAGPFEWDSAVRVANLSAVRDVMPLASYPEELLVRLDGRDVHGSGFKADWNQLLAPLQETVSGFSDTGVSLELTGVTSGSAVVHFRPASPDSKSDDSQPALDVPNDTTQFSRATEKLLELVETVSKRLPLESWKGHLKPFLKLAHQLNDLDLSADFTHTAPSGAMNAAELTHEGMSYLAELEVVQPSKDEMRVSGRVVALKEPGIVKIKTGTNTNSPVYDVNVPAEDLKRLRPWLGDNVHWNVVAETQTNGLGEVKNSTYTFTGIAEQKND